MPPPRGRGGGNSRGTRCECRWWSASASSLAPRGAAALAARGADRPVWVGKAVLLPRRPAPCPYRGGTAVFASLAGAGEVFVLHLLGAGLLAAGPPVHHGAGDQPGILP